MLPADPGARRCRTWCARPACAFDLVCRPCSGAGPGPGTGVATLERAPLVLAHATPDSGVLTGLDGPAQTPLGHVASPADLLGLFDLQQCRSCVADRKEQLGVHVTAGCAVAPVHAVHSFVSVELWLHL